MQEVRNVHKQRMGYKTFGAMPRTVISKERRSKYPIRLAIESCISMTLREITGYRRVVLIPNMIVTIHQPEHLPWLGFFDKIRQVNLYIILDHVQYRKNYYQNRNRVCGDRGAEWLTVPVLTKGKLAQPINEVQIDNRRQPPVEGKILGQHSSILPEGQVLVGSRGIFREPLRDGLGSSR